MIEVGKEYVFRGKNWKTHILAGKVVELVEDGNVARVELTRQCVGGNFSESLPGTILRVSMLLATAK